MNRPRRPHACQPTPAGAARQAQQHRFGLIVRCVAQRDVGRPHAAQRAPSGPAGARVAPAPPARCPATRAPRAPRR